MGVAVVKGVAAESSVGNERRLDLFLCARPPGVRRLQKKLSNCEEGFAAEKDAAAESSADLSGRTGAVETGSAGQSAKASSRCYQGRRQVTTRYPLCSQMVRAVGKKKKARRQKR